MLTLSGMGSRKVLLVKDVHFQISSIVVFHLLLETTIVANTSKQGLGAVLLQKNPENSVFQSVAFASCS